MSLGPGSSPAELIAAGYSWSDATGWTKAVDGRSASPTAGETEAAPDSGEPATAAIEELLHTLPFYVMEDVRRKWIAIVGRFIVAERRLALARAIEIAKGVAKNQWHGGVASACYSIVAALEAEMEKEE
jgi:hypothetical protein